MPASEETFRSQPTLHVVFAVSSVAMLLSIIWMIAADHYRPWKETQREFQAVERTKLEAAKNKAMEDQKAKFQSQIEEIDARLLDAEKSREERYREIRRVDTTLRKLGGRFEGLDTRKKFIKAELDSQRSLYDGMIDEGEERRARIYE